MHAYTHLLIWHGKQCDDVEDVDAQVADVADVSHVDDACDIWICQVPLQPSQPSVRDTQPGLRGSHRVTWQTGFIPPAQNKGAYPLVI